MSYYTIAPHHYYGHRAPSPPPHAHPSPYGSPRHPPHPHHASYDLDEEERLALAHLRAIRQRREAQQAALEREAAIRVKEERDNALRRALAEKKRQQAIAEATAALKRQREYEIQQAVEREREMVRAAILQQQHRRQQQHQHHQAQIHSAQQERARQVQAQQQRGRQLCTPRREVPTEVKEVKKEQNPEYEVLSNLLGSLFGITLDDEDEKVQSKPSPIPAPAPVVAQPPTPTPAQAAKSTSFPEDINHLLSHYLGLRIEPTTDTTPNPPTSKANTTPHGLNDFLSQYGLVFEPEESNSTQVEKKVSSPPTPVADPPEPVLPAPVATNPTPTNQPTQQAKDDHPLTDYFNGMVDLPPFLRDILGHAEVAYNQRQDGKKEEMVEGKWKKVADGEKNIIPPSAPIASAPIESTPTPTTVVEPTSTPLAPADTKPEPEPQVDDSATSLSTLSTISSDLSLVRDSFDFPKTLAFATPSPDNSDPPALLYNKVNSGYHAQTHKLLQLLLAADAIQSNGNKEVRRRRKEIVRAVEEEIEHLEKKRDEMWETVRAAKDGGGEDQDYEMVSSSSCGSSAVDPGEVKEEVEHVEDVKGEEVAGPSGYTVDTPSDQVLAEEVKESKAARVETADEKEEVRGE